MTRIYGRSLTGDRLISDVPFGHWQTQTFIAGLRHDGIVAPWGFNGSLNRASFDLSIETQLAPPLKQGNSVSLDTLSSHKSLRAKRTLRNEANGSCSYRPAALIQTR